MEKENMFVNEVDHCSYFNINPNWENSMDQNDPFESALSSMVSSPTASNTNITNNGENIVLRELIGRLGSICNSGDISPHHHHHHQQQPYNRSISIMNTNNSTNTSCYSTPLNSPPKLNLSMMENQQQIRGGGNNNYPNLAPFSTDPGFAERAARYSCFAPQNNEMGSQKLDSAVTGSHPMDEKKFKPEFGDSMENSSVSDQQIPIAGVANSRKRKSIPRGKGKETPPPPLPATDAHVGSENSESSSVKRSKSEEEKNAAKGLKDKNSKQQTTTATTTEAPKDYIHVRARRGQATDAHSLAERVRREKISERMKFLQDLVPGCNKVTGKAVMLDEIINYVQSLQRQVEFLSMKLATVNPRMDVNAEALMSKDMFQSHNIYRSDGYPFQPQPNSHSDIPSAVADAPFQANNNFNTAFGRSQSVQLPHMDSFTETASQVSTFWEDDLHSVVQMEFSQNQTQFSWLSNGEVVSWLRNKKESNDSGILRG